LHDTSKRISLEQLEEMNYVEMQIEDQGSKDINVNLNKLAFANASGVG
jgi:anti-sigma regulatory factor (Ser/Thr protein kinase)